MRELALVATGGALGASARWWLGGLLADRFGGMFPWHTLVVNLTGAFLLGLLLGLPADNPLAAGEWRLFLGIGVLGGYTTFSTLSFESMQLIQQGLVAQGLANMFGSGAAGLVAVAAGLMLARAI